jgi:hypothetical protein
MKWIYFNKIDRSPKKLKKLPRNLNIIKGIFLMEIGTKGTHSMMMIYKHTYNNKKMQKVIIISSYYNFLQYYIAN